MKPLDYTLYLVTDRKLAGSRSIEKIVAEAVRGGVTIVQFREKGLGDVDFLRQAFILKELTDRLGVPLIVNDRLEVAVACGAAGVHLGQGDMGCAQARKIAGEQPAIGVSVSTPEEAVKAEAEGASYLGVSPVFSTPTKTDTPAPAGLDGLRRIREKVRIPLVGIGGISAANAADVIRSGADGIAVVSAIMASRDPCMAARSLRSAMGR